MTVSIVAQPHLPLILASAGFLATLRTVEDQVANLAIIDAASAQQAADLQQRLTDAGRKLEESRLLLKRPYMDQAKAIDDAAKAPALRIETAKNALKRGLTTFATRQSEEARKIELARQAELARLEEVRLEEERAAQEKADRIAKETMARAPVVAAPPAQPVWDEEEAPSEEAPPPPKTATELAIEQVKFAPAAVVVKPTGVRYKTVLIATVTDVRLLPDMFVERLPKMGAIKASFCVGYKEGDPLPECSGVKFEVSKTAESTGRALF